MARQDGFTLLELMIMIALMLIINQTEVQYQATYGGYAESLANLGGADPCTKSAETACLLDQNLAGGTKSGYGFAEEGGNPSGGLNTSYVVGAAPEEREPA